MSRAFAWALKRSKGRGLPIVTRSVGETRHFTHCPASRRTMILKVSVGNIGDVIHPAVAPERDGKNILSTVLEGFIFPTPVETI